MPDDNPYEPPSIASESPREAVRTEVEITSEPKSVWAGFKHLVLTVVRTMSYTAGTLTLMGGSFGLLLNENDRSLTSTMALIVVAFAGITALTAGVICCFAGLICTKQELEQRPLLLAMACNFLSIIANLLLAPVFG